MSFTLHAPHGAQLHEEFARRVYPKVVSRAGYLARKWAPWARDELTAEALGEAWRIVESAARRGLEPFRWPWVVARYAVGRALRRLKSLRLRSGLAPLPREVEDRRAPDPSARS